MCPDGFLSYWIIFFFLRRNHCQRQQECKKPTFTFMAKTFLMVNTPIKKQCEAMCFGEEKLFWTRSKPVHDDTVHSLAIKNIAHKNSKYFHNLAGSNALLKFHKSG